MMSSIPTILPDVVYIVMLPVALGNKTAIGRVWSHASGHLAPGVTT